MTSKSPFEASQIGLFQSHATRDGAEVVDIDDFILNMHQQNTSRAVVFKKS